jgi:hypothetical protein
MSLLMLMLAVTVLAGCADERGSSDADTARTHTQQAVPRERTPGEEAPTPAASNTSSTGASVATPPPLPDGDTPTPAPDGDLQLARFTGYGDIPFGTSVADMTRLWGGELKVIGKDLNDQCYFMTPAWSKRPADFSFMISEGRFARLSVESRNFVAPGGAHVGMTKAEVVRRYAGRIEVQPHKYSDGQYLRVTDPAGGRGVLLLETDGKDDDARVTEWRVGVPPEVDYVEGCS